MPEGSNGAVLKEFAFFYMLIVCILRKFGNYEKRVFLCILVEFVRLCNLMELRFYTEYQIWTTFQKSFTAPYSAQMKMPFRRAGKLGVNCTTKYQGLERTRKSVQFFRNSLPSILMFVNIFDAFVITFDAFVQIQQKKKTEPLFLCKFDIGKINFNILKKRSHGIGMVWFTGKSTECIE